MADRLTYGQEQAEENLRYWQGLSRKMRKPSLMASPEEKAAYTAQEVRAGNAPEYALPEDYGGMPQGTTRRAIRAREAWGQQQAYIAGLAEQERQIEQAAREEQKFQLDYASKAYDLRTKQNEDLFELRTAADLKQAEAEFTEFRNKLNPNDPESAGMIYSYISSDPRLAESKVAYTSAEFFDKAAKNSASSIAIKQQEDLNNAKSEARRAGIPEEDINKVVIGARERDDNGNEFININKALGGITQLTDTTIGKRAVSAEERKEPTDTRSLAEKAQDEFAEASAKLSAFVDPETGEVDEDIGNSEAYRRALGDVKAAQVKVNRLGGKPDEPSKPVSTGILKITSKEEFDKLQSGEEFIAPDGTRRRKQ